MTESNEQMWRADGLSMGPAWGPDAVLVTRPVSDSHPVRLGDVVVYELGGGLIAHRVVRIRHASAGTYFRTQGDGNWSPDEIEVGPDSIRGVVVAVMKNDHTIEMGRVANLGRGLMLRLKSVLARLGRLWSR